MKTERFIERLVELSVSSDFFTAQNEWEVDHLEYVEDDVCICGQKHINKIVVMHNKYNNKFIRIRYTCYRTTLKGICYDTEFKKLMYEYKLSRLGIFKMPTAEQILDNFNRYIINEWELKFLISVKRFSHYSEKQTAIIKKLLPKLYRDSTLTKEIDNYGIDETEEPRLFVLFREENHITFLDDILIRDIKNRSW